MRTLFCVIAIVSHLPVLGQVTFEPNPSAGKEVQSLFLVNYAFAGTDTLPADTFRVTAHSRLFGKSIEEILLVYHPVTHTFIPVSSASCKCYVAKAGEKTDDMLDLVLFALNNNEATELSRFQVYKQVPLAGQTEKQRTNPVSVHGQVRSENYWSDNRFDNQALPLAYSRTSLDMQLALGDLPFRTGFLYTTEANRMNSFYFSFDYQAYKNNLVKKLNAERAKKAEMSLNNDLKIGEQLARIDKDRFQIDNELRGADYRKKLDRYKKDVESGASDTAFKHTRRYKKAAAFLEADSLKKIQFAELGRLRERIRAADIKNNPKLFGKDALHDQEKINYGLKDAGIKQPAFGIFSSVRRLDLGTFSPRYNALMLDGVQAMGLNLEINKGIAYAAWCGGEIRTGLVNYGIYDQYRTSFTAARAGIRKEGKYSLVFTGVRGNGAARQPVEGRKENGLANQVIGGEASYHIGKGIVLRAEYAQSTQAAVPGMPGDFYFLSAQKKEQFGFSAAWLTQASWKAANNKTQLDFSYQQTGPGYFSVAAPYIRRDNRKIEARLNQKLYKNTWSMFASVRTDKDNLYGTKAGNTFTHWFTLGTRLMPARLPYLVVSVSPLWQYTYLSVMNTFIVNKVYLYNVLLGYTVSGENVVNTSTFNYIKNDNYAILGNEAGDRAFIMQSVVLNNSSYYKPLELVLTTGIRSLRNVIVLTDRNDSAAASGVSYDLMITKKLPSVKTSVDAGYSYITGLSEAYRNVWRLGVNSTIVPGFVFNLRMERHAVYSAIHQFTIIHLCKATLIKNF